MDLPANERRNDPPRTNITWIIGVALILIGGAFMIAQFMNVGDTVWSIALIGSGLTFFAIYLLDRSRWWALIPGYILAVTGVFLPLDHLLHGNGDAIYWLAAVGLPFLVAFLVNRKNWWALIPAGIMLATAVFLSVERMLNGNMEAVYWTGLIGAIFFVVFLTDVRRRWWALIPFYVMATTSLFLIMEPALNDNATGAYWTLALAVPFLVVFITDTHRWWALIPAGIFGSAGLGLAISSATIVVPIVLIAAGIFVLVRQVGSHAAATPLTGPAADHGAEPFEAIGARETGPEADRVRE